MPDTQPDPIRRLAAIVAHLRSPDGCPWDQAQTISTMSPYLLEECHELLAAIEDGTPEHVCDELGDLLLQIIFIAQLHTEAGHFDLDRAAESICAKMVRRHPHVFADVQVNGMTALDQQWDAIKRDENSIKASGMFSTVPTTLPALQRAQMITEKAGRVGFDWPETTAVVEKLKEEITELEAAIEQRQQHAIESELGDVLFSTVNLARHLSVDAETSLRKTTARFLDRFSFIESTLTKEGLSPDDVSLERLNQLWEAAKKTPK